jgi:hypothetical protein
MSKQIPPNLRSEFAEAMSSIQFGMASGDVLSLLGTPDEIRSGTDLLPKGDFPNLKEIWCYGVCGPNRLATLGQVWIGDDGGVRRVSEGGITTVIATMSEEQLRNYLVDVSQAPDPSGEDFDPLYAMKIINRFSGLDVAVVCDIIQEYLRIAGQERLMTEPSITLLLRILIETPHHPTLLPLTYFGSSYPTVPENIGAFPRFPMEVWGDVPLLVVEQFSPKSTTGTHTIQPLLDYYQKHGQIRHAPLHPANSPLALTAVIFKDERFRKTNWSESEQRRVRVILMNQLLRLVRSVYPVDALVPGQLDDMALDQLWASHVERFNALDVVWDTTLEDYRLR